MMRRSTAAIWMMSLLLVLSAPIIQSTRTTVPAFLWFSHLQDSQNGIENSIDYRTISQKDLPKVILSEGGWSTLLCPGANVEQTVDIGLVFVGRELQSSDISRNEHADPALLHLIKESFTRSKSSMAFPYVSSSDGNETMESSLLSGLTESCGNGLEARNIAILESCSVDGGNFQKLADMQAVHKYLDVVMKNKQDAEKNLIIVCNGGSVSSEGEIFSEILSLVDKSGTSYSVLYASDPKRSAQYPSYRALDRVLAESAVGNVSLKAFSDCDGVCQIKSSLLEGLLVAIVLLIILISGLCCMMGIDTPTRFESPQDS